MTRDHPDGPRLTVTWSWPQALLAETAVRDLAEDGLEALALAQAEMDRPEAMWRSPK